MATYDNRTPTDTKNISLQTVWYRHLKKFTRMNEQKVEKGDYETRDNQVLHRQEGQN